MDTIAQANDLNVFAGVPWNRPEATPINDLLAMKQHAENTRGLRLRRIRVHESDAENAGRTKEVKLRTGAILFGEREADDPVAPEQVHTLLRQELQCGVYPGNEPGAVRLLLTDKSGLEQAATLRVL